MNETNNDPQKANILIVDDEPSNVLLLEKMLAMQGYSRVVTTLDPRNVLSLCQEHDFQLILLDINMPEMDGYEVLEQLRNEEKLTNTQVVAISGDIYSTEITKALDAGFSDYISKPFKIQSLLDIVDKTIQKSDTKVK